MKRKNILALLLALVMAFALATASLAVPSSSGSTTTTDPETSTTPDPETSTSPDVNDTGDTTISGQDQTGEATVTVDGELTLPTVEVVVPAGAGVVVNPYKMYYKENEEDSPKTDTVISAAQYITNTTKVPLKVEATPTATTEGGAKLVATKDEVGGTSEATAVADKNVFLQLKLAPTDADAEADFAAEGADIVVVKDDGSTTAEITLDAVDGANVVTNRAGFQVTGDCASYLSSGAWTNADTVSVSIAFSFTVQPNVSEDEDSGQDQGQENDQQAGSEEDEGNG